MCQNMLFLPSADSFHILPTLKYKYSFYKKANEYKELL